MQRPSTQRSDGVKDGEISFTAEGSAESSDSPITNGTTSKENETDLAAFQMHRFSNREDENELETVEIIALNSSVQQLGNETMTESYLVAGKRLFFYNMCN